MKRSAQDRGALRGFATAAFALGLLCFATITRAADALTFEKDIRPILKAHCFECHGEGEQPKGGLDLRLRRLMLAGGENGPVVVPGKPDASPLLKLVGDGTMPKRDKKLTVAEVALIRRWIIAGAKTVRPEPLTPPEGAGITEEERAFWSFQPIRDPAVPKTAARDRARTPIDAFLVRSLKSKKLRFSPDAEKTTLLRRACFDLTGLPPTPEQTEDFLRDTSADAYEKLVDRLLDSKQHGERWGRHWLDVAGYADSDGYSDADPPRAHAHKYRDYVIRAFNEDKPFDRFVQEQIAADQLDTASDPQTLSALAFLTIGWRKDVKIDDDTLDNALDTIGRGVLGLSVACARCHDHKLEPITTKDYYGLFHVLKSCKEPDVAPTLPQPDSPEVREFREKNRVLRGDYARQSIKSASDAAHTARGRLGDYLVLAEESGWKTQYENKEVP
ncbi:MAG: DUF1549 domain-containing protein, partial [Verrucomicrobiota bacterium]